MKFLALFTFVLKSKSKNILIAAILEVRDDLKNLACCFIIFFSSFLKIQKKGERGFFPLILLWSFSAEHQNNYGAYDDYHDNDRYDSVFDGCGGS